MPDNKNTKKGIPSLNLTINSKEVPTTKKAVTTPPVKKKPHSH